MAKYEEFKQNVTESYEKVKEKLSDALLTEEGKLDTDKIGNVVTDTFNKVEEGVKDGYRKVSESVTDENGNLDKEKVSAAANKTYRKAGRFLAVGLTKLAGKLTDIFGVQEEGGEIIDTEVVVDEPAQEPAPEAVEVTAEAEDFVEEAPTQEEP